MSAFNVDRGNTRFALLAYAKYVDTLITLNEYKDQTDLLSLLDDLTSKTFNVKDTTLALYEARKIFRKESSDDRKKVVVIFTNGFSRGMLMILVKQTHSKTLLINALCQKKPFFVRPATGCTSAIVKVHLKLPFFYF